MQQVFRRHLVTRSPDYGQRLRAVGKRVDTQDAASPHAVLMDFVEAGIQSLHHLGATTDPRQLERAVAISFPDYTPQVLDTVGEGRRRGAGVIAITDGPLSPLLPLATVALEVEEI